MKFSVLSFLLSFLIVNAGAQSEKDVIQASTITWFGVDFSKATLVGSFTQFKDAGDKNEYQIINTYMPAWNNIIVNEREKYDVEKTYKKSSVQYELDVVSTRNQEIDGEKLFSLNAPEKSLTHEQLSEVTAGYKSGKSGVGLVYIVESFNKHKEDGAIWVTFFDMSTGSVLIAERFSARPGGIGLRNYWANTIHDVMVKSSYAYTKWQRLYK
jgi:hypothetical protein